jgi:BirA family transcriptional regulator, biotin operon repressor / biotin---[acetyl-CoA-carboxylase] ligase
VAHLTDATGRPVRQGRTEWNGRTVAAWAELAGATHLEVHDALPSTNDRAHALAADGAAAGTVVLARTQTAGRGRHGRTWASAPDAGVWCSVLERPTDPAAIGVLALRVGLALADALAPLASPAPLRLKWPNDLFAGDAKLAGVLIEGRWQDTTPLWVVIGVGVNLVVPQDVPAAGLGATCAPVAFPAIVRAVRAAAACRGCLSAHEQAAWAMRDLAAGRALVEPGAGIASGIAADGALQVRQAHGIATFHSGSLVFA